LRDGGVITTQGCKPPPTPGHRWRFNARGHLLLNQTAF
jgi:hypothetical protein